MERYSRTRRNVLTGMALAGVSSLAGCSLPEIPFLGQETPKLRRAWLEVTESGDANVLLVFDGDIQSSIEAAPFSKDDLLSSASDAGLDVTFTPVTITDRHRIVPDAERDSSNLVHARIPGFAAHSDVVGRPRYSTHSITYEKQLREERTPTATIGECSSYRTPAHLPDMPLVPFHIIFPGGDHFVLPRANELATSSRQLVSYIDNDPFDYAAADPERTFPFIIHYSHPKLVSMRLAAKYRYRLIQEIYRLVTYEWYECQTYGAIQEGVAGVSETLAVEALQSFLTSPIPDEIMAPLDIKGVHDTMTAEFPQLQNSLSSLSRLSSATLNEAWMNDLTSGGLDASETPGLGRLFALSVVEYALQNPVLAASSDAAAFKQNIETYERLLDEQLAIPNRLLDPSSIFRTVPQFGNDYWQNLHDFARTLLQQSRQSITRSQALLEDVKRDLETP